MAKFFLTFPKCSIFVSVANQRYENYSKQQNIVRAARVGDQNISPFHSIFRKSGT